MTYVYWTLGITVWMVIGWLMLRYVWKDTHGGLAMVAHDVPVFGMLLLVAVVAFWPYPQLLVYLFVILPMELWEKTSRLRWGLRQFVKTGRWPKRAKKEDPKRTNFDKVQQQPRLSDEEVDAIMACAEYYVAWVRDTAVAVNEHGLQTDRGRFTTPEECEKRRHDIASRLAFYLNNPHAAVKDMKQDDANHIARPKAWHRKLSDIQQGKQW